jgi:gas vesicle protein
MMKMKTMMKGLGLGIIAGAFITAAIVPIDARRLRRSKPAKAIRAIGQVVEGITESFT